MRLPGPWETSLRARLVAYFLLLSTVTVAVLGLAVYARATDDLTRSVFERLSAVAEVKADALDRWIDEQRRNVVFVGSIPGLGDAARDFLATDSTSAERRAAREILAKTLGVVLQQTADAQEFMILDLSGRIRLSTVPSHEGVSQAEEFFFTNGVSHTTVQNAHASTLTNLPTITISNPLFDADGRGRRVGVLAGNLNLERIDRIVLERTGLGEGGATYLVGLDHRFVHVRLNQGAFAAGVASTGIDLALGGGSGEALYTDYRGVPVIGVYRWIEEHDAALLVELPQAEAFVPARQLALTIAAVGLGSALLLAVGIWLVARQVTRPILDLATAATAVAGGDLSATAAVTSRDEVGRLGRAFDDMTAQLRESVETLERRVEERTGELRRQKQYFESLVEISPAAVVTMDRDERVSAWNPAATRLFGFTPDEAIGQVIDDLIMATDAMRAEGHGVASEALASGRSSRMSQRSRKDGGVVDVEIVMVPLIVDGQHTGFYAVYHDITELQAARREADDANLAKSSFLAAMSHEIRTPMNAIIGMSGLLLDTPLADEQRDYAETIQGSGDALLTIINDILDFSKIEAGRIDLESAPFDLRRAIEGALDVLAPAAAKKGIELAFELDGAVPARLVGDAGRFRQIVLNLLSNAVKFTETGEVVVTGRASMATKEGSPGAGDPPWEIAIDVRDTGIGIPPDRIDRLFQSFSQADSSIARRFGGTGLGLVISRRLAEAMGGSLTVDSAGVPGEGSTFRLRIVVPALPEDADEVAADLLPVVFEGRHALVVDDNATTRRILVAHLRGWGMTAAEADSGATALALLGATRFDLVISDVRMPGMDGTTLATEIRAMRPGPPLPVILLSSVGERLADDAPVAGNLIKPVKPTALRDLVASVLANGVMPTMMRTQAAPSPSTDLAARFPLRILLAEDNAVNQKLAVRLLERMGYDPAVAGDGLAAIAALDADDFDVVLMDVQMPELDGLDATRQIRARWPDRPLRIVAMTANAMAEDREACLAAGMDDYLSKPIRVEELASALERAAGRSGSTA